MKHLCVGFVRPSGLTHLIIRISPRVVNENKTKVPPRYSDAVTECHKFWSTDEALDAVIFRGVPVHLESDGNSSLAVSNLWYPAL